MRVRSSEMAVQTCLQDKRCSGSLVSDEDSNAAVTALEIFLHLTSSGTKKLVHGESLTGTSTKLSMLRTL